jgi:hypothetical protein
MEYEYQQRRGTAMKKMTLLLCFFFLTISFTFAQEVKWDGELRVRSEMDNRDFETSTPSNYYTLMRTRLGALVQPIENVKVYLQIQDSRTFGEERDANNKFNPVNNMHNLDLSQGFMQINNFIYNNITLKLGRMKLFYGDGRLIAPSNWSNIGRSFDGGFLSYEIPNHKFEGFVMNVGETTIPPASATPNDVMYVRDYGKLFSGFYYSNSYFSNHKIDLYLLHDLDRRVSVPGYNDLNRFTAGIFTKGAIQKEIFYQSDIAFQVGTARDKDITASLFALTAGYKFENSSLSSLSLSFEHLSGTPDQSSVVRTFDPVYGTVHEFYGLMDYFVNIPRDTYDRGLQDIYATVVLKTSENTSVHCELHDLRLAESLSGQRALGQELGIIGNLKYNKFVSFEVGACAFIPGKVIRAAYGSSDVSEWAYLTALVSF